jgi:hypothetical protein
MVEVFAVEADYGDGEDELEESEAGFEDDFDEASGGGASATASVDEFRRDTHGFLVVVVAYFSE